GAGGFVTLAGVNDRLSPMLGLVEFILEQIEPGEPEPGGRGFRTGLEQVTLCRVIFFLRQIELAQAVERRRVVRLEFDYLLKRLLGLVPLSRIKTCPSQTIPGSRVPGVKRDGGLEL